MIRCNSPYANCYNKCVIDIDGQQSIGGNICCDTAEDLKFKREGILTHCKYAQPIDIHDAALKELFG